MSTLSLHLFGTPRIEVDGKRIKVSRRKAVALLAYLAVTQQNHSRDVLATMLWPEADQSRSRASLRSALWTLNKTALAEWLLVEGETVALRSRPDSGEAALGIDVIRFRELLSVAQSHDHTDAAACAECIDRLSRAVALYGNDFLAGFTLPDAPAFDEWHFFEANSLRQKLTSALQSLIAFHSAQGDRDRAISFASRLVALDPLHEPAQRTLMQAYAQAGRQSTALRQYELCREALEAELGLEPAAETKALYERIRSGDWKVAPERGKDGDGDGVAGDEKGQGVIPNNLAPDPTRLVGRREELARLAAFLDDPATRLLTITGPGGIGKTRLALASAADQIGKRHFPDGIFFVSLAPLSEPEAIIPAIAEAAGYPFQADKRSPRQQIFDFLGQKSMLLLLDNFEHLLGQDQADGAALVADLLQHAPGLKIVATSREPLNLYEEQRYPLQGLEVADAELAGAELADGELADGEPGEAGTEYAAASLFLQTARRRQPGFDVAPGDSAYLADICRLVEGMPLALELAASWIEVLSLREIAAEIRQSLDLMETNVRNVPARHRSMQAVFDTSWQSLSETEQTLYAQLSLFRGGFTREAARAVTEASRQALARLVRKSLLRFNRSQGRYENHELLRQYAAEKLADDAEETRGRHAAYYCAFLEQRESDLKGAGQQQALSEIEADHENVLAAWQWCVEQSQIARLQKALVPFCLFYQGRSRFEEGETGCRLAFEALASTLADRDGETESDMVTAADRNQTHLLVRLLTWQGRFNINLGLYERARELLRRAQRVLDRLDAEAPGVAATRAFLLLHLSEPYVINDFGGQAEALNEESLQLYRALDDSWGTALALDALSQKKMNLGLHESAIELHEECLAIRRRLEDRHGVARSYSLLGLFSLHIGELERSEAYLRESLAIYRAMDNRADMSNPLAILAINLLFAGRFEECVASYEECWAIHREFGIVKEPHTANVGMTRAKINLGRYEEARRQAETDLVAYRASNQQWNLAFTLFNLGRIDLVEGAAEPAREHLEESATILRKMNERSLLPDVLFCLAYGARALGERERAVQYMVQALRMAIETEPLNPMRFELPGMALLLADEGEGARAVELYAAALQSPYIANCRWFEDVAGWRIEEVAAELPEDVVVAARERGRGRDLWETANAVLVELERVEEGV